MNKIGSETLHGSVSSFIRSKIYDKELAAGDKIPSEHRPHFRRRGPPWKQLRIHIYKWGYDYANAILCYNQLQQEFVVAFIR